MWAKRPRIFKASVTVQWHVYGLIPICWTLQSLGCEASKQTYSQGDGLSASCLDFQSRRKFNVLSGLCEVICIRDSADEKETLSLQLCRSLTLDSCVLSAGHHSSVLDGSNRDGVVGIAKRCACGARVFDTEAHPASCTVGTGFLSRG